MEQLEGRHAFITGGASGIGLGIARALLDAGMTVTIADFRKDHIDTAMALFDSLQKGRDTHAIELDVTDRASFARAADEVYAKFGAVHVLVNNAGVGIIGPIASATFSDWDLGLDINIGGVVNGITTFLPRMIAQETGGHVVNTASLAAISPSPRDSTIYATTKAAVMAMSEAMQEELADHNIGVSVLLPGPFKTNIREVGRNRPARYQTGSGYRAVEERLAEREDAPDWLDPLEAGRMVRDAIMENRLYVITHGEFKGWAESKFEDILAAYPPPRDPERAMGRRRPVQGVRMIELYHAEPASNSLKVLICLKEKGVDFVSHLMDIQAFEQHEPWFVAINPDGQVPVLVHDGKAITESTVINEYLEQVFPNPPLRPEDPIACARMRTFTKYVDEYFRPALSQIGWQMMIHTITDKFSKEEFEAKLARIPREEKREKWRIAAAQGYTPEQMAAWRRTLAEGIGKMEGALANAPWLAGSHCSLADIACFAMAAHMPGRFTDIINTSVSPRVLEWHARMAARPAVAAALAMPSPVRAR